ncbi:MAG: hypothetical protein FWH53_09965 [Leptospirales bacterium]|nr:hypothetical protein [Leptospirales bacterium]MCL2155978.1 hypothetical protein [Leptospirales bacterium]
MVNKIIPAVIILILFIACNAVPPKQTQIESERIEFTGCTKYLSSTLQYENHCADGDCDNGTGIYIFSNGNCYEGGFKNKTRCGYGVMFYKSIGEKYEGNWLDDNRVGAGCLYFNNGDTYTGEFKFNVPWGAGVYRYADGSTEEGEFFDYLFAGVIKLPELTDSDKHEVGRVVAVDLQSQSISIAGSNLKIGDRLFVEINGLMAALEVITLLKAETQCRMIGEAKTLINGVKIGMPVFKMMIGIKRAPNIFLFFNGNRYIGEYKENLMHGKGEFHRINSNIYRGEYKNGLRDGKGVLTFYNGASYSGDWKNGYMDGQGEYIYSNESRYTGRFVKGFKEGRAISIYYNADIYTGNFKANLMDGYGEYKAKNGDTYSGEFKNDKKNGKGTYTWHSGDKYIGDWKNDLQDGSGTYIWSDGVRYVGYWEESKKHGKGIEYDAGGNIIQQGIWDNGVFIGNSK